ncbi:MAG: hypothetical protein KKC05_01030, partial [Nanoarchaeota archaeon]|nr:hypothetical protein [Nanoarchaeota archaeon]
PARRSNPETIQNSIETIISKIKDSDYIDLINAPEITEENYEGRPFYKSVDVAPLSQKLHQGTGKNIIINSVVGHFESKDAFIRFIKKVKNKYGIQNIVLVGVANPHNTYPGPNVGEANKIASEMGVNVGNICIPHRPEEIDRMVGKTEAGCSFFTTQILLEEDKIKNVLLEYDRMCKEKSMKPARIFLSFATVADEYDLEFFKWLGIEISEKTEEEMKQSGNMTEYCTSRIKDIYKSVLEFKKENSISVPLGLNICQVSARNLEPSLKLARELAQIKV